MSEPSACGVDAAALLRHLDQPAAAPDISAHVAGCAECQKRLLEMAKAATSSGHGRRSHAECAARLPAFAHARAAGVPERDEDLLLMTHLALCQECFAAYVELRAMQEITVNDVRPMPPRAAYRPPDLSFLHPVWLPGLVQTLRISLALLFQGSPLALAPAPVRGGEAQVAPGEGPAWRQASFGVEQLGTLDVDLRLVTDRADPQRARLEVYAQAAQQLDLDFSGTRVTLRFSEGREEARLTDAAGLALFEGVLEAELRTAVLEITPAGRQSP